MLNINICEICKSKDISLIKRFNKQISGENLFGLEFRKDYQRSLYRCQCGHFYNFHKYSKFLDKVYKKSYSNYSHNDIEKKFNKIISLKKKSSNLQRVKFLKKILKKNSQILDVGSGFGIFPFEIKKLGFNIDCVESDKEMSNFLKRKKLNLISRDLMKVKNLKKKYDLITFNKVLEHFELTKIIKILRNYKKMLKKNGQIYIEVPDSLAANNNLNRQEFFFEHYNIFSQKSLTILLNQIGFKIEYLKSTYEINDKFTLRAIINA
jgi:2-polyprenyl-3-methyl-5-hydroxy-6-metoxy-1,4-benzoquinol methylase